MFVYICINVHIVELFIRALKVVVMYRYLRFECPKIMYTTVCLVCFIQPR